MICVDDVTSSRHRKLGLCVRDDCNEPDMGLQTGHRRHDPLLGSWHHRKFLPLCLRWKHKVQQFGLIFLLVILLLLVLVLWVSQMALAELETTDSFFFASLGDFGSGSKTQDRVAQMVCFSYFPFSNYLSICMI